MDNRVFNVNGPMSRRGEPSMLAAAIQLVMTQTGNKSANGWAFVQDKGIILFSYGPGDSDKQRIGYTPFLTAATAEECASMIERWLQSPAAETVPKTGWDADYDGDGYAGPGWRCYVEDWGHVAGLWGVICAVRPADMWYGK